MIKRLKAAGKVLIGKSLTPEEAFLRGLPIESYASGPGSVASAYDNSAIAFACIRRLAVDAGNAPYLLLTDVEDPDSVIPEDHPIARLFKQPNPWFESNQFMEYIYTLLNLRGEFFLTFDNPSNPTEIIQFYDPLHWKALISTDRRLVGWTYLHETVGFSRVPSDIVHHKSTNISNPFRGQSPLQAAAGALWASIDGDTLTASIMARGGEQGLVYSTEQKLLPTQEEELQASLRSRRAGRATAAGDTLLAGGITILDPKFTGFDYQLFERMGPAEQKIIQVYGLSPSMIGRDDEPNYATFMGRLRIYWRQTLLPMMSAVEATFDEFLRPHGVYFRYDRTNIAGLQEDLKEQAQIALILNRGGIPWSVINDRLKLGLDADRIPGSDEVMVPGTVVPLSLLLEEYTNPSEPAPVTPSEPSGIPADASTPDDDKAASGEARGTKHPDYATMVKRSKDIGSLIARTRKLAGLERAVSSAWRKLSLEYKRLATKEMDKALKENHTVEGAVLQFGDKFGPVMNTDYADDSVEQIMPRSIQAAGEGEVSIEQLVKRLTADEIKQFSKEPAELLSGQSLLFIRDRENLVRGMGPKLFDNLMYDLTELVKTEGEVAEVAGTVRQMVGATFNASVNRAVTIARTEIGTAFNVGRFNNMQEQGYSHHEWITNIDEFTRDEHADSDGEVRKIGSGDLFPSGLAYPQDPQGGPEQVINCRCMTIPITQEQYDERS